MLLFGQAVLGYGVAVRRGGDALEQGVAGGALGVVLVDVVQAGEDFLAVLGAEANPALACVPAVKGAFCFSVIAAARGQGRDQ